MRALKILAAVIVAGAAVACGSSSSTSTTHPLVLDGRPMAECLLSGTVQARCGMLSVPENPGSPEGRHIELRVVVVPAQTSPVQPDPVFFLAGGPGGAATESWSQASLIFPGIHYQRDIVLVDQRGTGSSHAMTFPDVNPGESISDYVRRALAAIDGDPRYYTTSVAMDDLDTVRAALGYTKIDLYGGSYGATAAQYYMRQHADHLRAVVLDGGTALDVPIMELIAANSQRALDAVFDRCAADFDCNSAFPDVRQELPVVLALLDNHPLRTRVLDSSGEPIVVTRELFAGVIHSRLLTASDAATIPLLIHSAASGRFDAIVTIAASLPPSPLQVMSAVIRCSEAWARFDPAEVMRTGAGSYYASAQAAAATGQAAGCQYLPKGVVPAGDGLPPASTIPVLLLNGDADPQDPPANVAGLGDVLPNSLEVVVPGQGHTVGHLGCLTGVVAEFIERGAVDAPFARQCAATIQTPPFQLS